MDINRFNELLKAVEATKDNPIIYYLPYLKLVPVGTKDISLTGIYDIRTVAVFGLTKENASIELKDTDYCISYDTEYKLTILNTDYDHYIIKYNKFYSNEEIVNCVERIS